MWTKILTGIIFIYKNWYKYWAKFLTVIGDIKVYPLRPLFFIYNPEEYDYKVRGYDIRQIMKIIKPGDILLRRYEHYLDSALIPGKYSHSGIYVGNHTIIHAVAEGVREIDIIDYCLSDGLLLLRPKKGIKKAVKRAKDSLGCCYDFKFNSSDSSAFYCHELTAHCYRELDIEAYPIKFCGKVLPLLDKKFLAESFICNDNIDCLLEIDPTIGEE